MPERRSQNGTGSTVTEQDPWTELQICAWKGWGGQLEDRSVLMFSSQKTNKKKDEGEARDMNTPSGWCQPHGFWQGRDPAGSSQRIHQKHTVFKGFANPSETFLSLSGRVIPRPPKTRRHHQEDYTLNSMWVFLWFLRQCRIQFKMA